MILTKSILAFLMIFQSILVSSQTMNSTEPAEPKLPSIAEKYGYGSIAVIIVSLLALVGIVLLPCFNRSIYNNVLDSLNALAVGTLFSDAMLHMIPDILGLEHGEHGEKSNDSVHVPDHVIKICVAILFLYLFWILETLARHFAGLKSNSLGHVHGHSHDIYTDIEENGSSSASDNTNNEETKTKVIPKKNVSFFANLKKVNTLGWMIILGDAIHNLADGLAIGASFSQSITLGLSTTIAVICHEIPHELGNYAVLVKCGFSHIQALLFNLLSASTCLIGFYVGVSISSDSSVSEWILTITVGMFLYIALVELLPTLIRDDNWSWSMFLIINIALFIGFAIMFLLVVFEEHIKF